MVGFGQVKGFTVYSLFIPNHERSWE